jgi:putative SOS response-associated peptidase YedK
MTGGSYSSLDLWDVAAISELLKPYDASQMRCYTVSSRVNHVGNDDEECSRRVEIGQTQTSPFS